MKTAFPYRGGKTRLKNWILPHIPEHRTYVEPFFGSGAIFLAKEPAKIEIINDLDDRIVNFYRVLRDTPELLVRACTLTPYSRAEYHSARTRPLSDDPVENARRFFVIATQSFAGTTGPNAGFGRQEATGTTNRARQGANYTDRLEAVAERIRSVMIEHRDAVALIDTYRTSDTVLYCDPPYVGTGRSGGHSYLAEMSDEDHRRMSKSLHETEALVLLSGYPSDLYDELFRDWYRIGKIHNSPIGAKKGGTVRTEVLWSNRPLRL